VKQTVPLSLPFVRTAALPGRALARAISAPPLQALNGPTPHAAQNRPVKGPPLAGAAGKQGAGARSEALAATSRELLPHLKRWLVLVRALESSLTQSRHAILHLNADGILKGAAEQESLCGELSRVQNQLSAQGDTVKKRGSAVLFVKLSPAEMSATAEVKALQRELFAAQRKIQYAARFNGALLRRCARNAAALRNLYLSCLGTYSNPAAASTNFGL